MKNKEEQYYEMDRTEDQIEAGQAANTQSIWDTIPPEQKKCDLFEEIGVFGISLRGRSHQTSGMPCQDSNDFWYLPQEKMLIAAIADGVGSCELSHWGAYIAVQEVMRFLGDWVRETAQGSSLRIASLSETQIREMFEKAFAYTRDKVEKFADQCSQPVFHFQSTLTVVLYDGNQLACYHVGDDGVVAQGISGKYQMITQRHKGDTVNSVYTLQSGMGNCTIIGSDVAGFMMSTDGVLDFYVTNDNRVYYPFLQRFLYGMKPKSGLDTRQAVQHTMEQAIAYLDSDPECLEITDDMTILAVVNQRHISNVIEPVFSKKEWEDESKRRYEEQQKRLRDLSEAYKTKPLGIKAKKQEERILDLYAPSRSDSYRNFEDERYTKERRMNLGKYDDTRYGDERYGNARYTDTKAGNVKSDYSRYRDTRYGDSKYPDFRYDDARHDDSRYSDARRDDSRYSDARRDDSRYSDARRDDSRYSDARCDDSRYSDARRDDFRYDDRRYEDSRYDNVRSRNTNQNKKGVVGSFRERVGNVADSASEKFSRIVDGVRECFSMDFEDDYYLCPRCKREVFYDEKFCYNCNMKLIHKCPNPHCNNKVYWGDSECSRCHTKIKWGSNHK